MHPVDHSSEHHYIDPSASVPPHAAPVHPIQHGDAHSELHEHLVPRVPTDLPGHLRSHSNDIEEEEDNFMSAVSKPHYDEINYEIPKEACWIDMKHRKEGPPPCPLNTAAIHMPGLPFKKFGCYEPCGADMMTLGPYCTSKDLVIPRGFTVHSDIILDKPLFRMHYVAKNDHCGPGYIEGKVDKVGKKECHAGCPKGFLEGGLKND